MAQSYSSAAKFAEAYVLFKRAAEQAQSASEAYQKVKRPDEVRVAASLGLSIRCSIAVRGSLRGRKFVCRPSTLL